MIYALRCVIWETGRYIVRFISKIYLVQLKEI